MTSEGPVWQSTAMEDSSLSERLSGLALSASSMETAPVLCNHRENGHASYTFNESVHVDMDICLCWKNNGVVFFKKI